MPIPVFLGLPTPRLFRCFRLAGCLFGAVSLLSACSTEPAETTTGKPAKAAKATTETPATPETAPLHVSVFLEYSGGMKGFVPRGSAGTPATEFQKRIGALITETQVSPVVAERKFYLCENAAPKEVKFEQLRNLVQGNVTQAALGTELPQMLEGILSQPKAAREVSVIISDFIYGPEDGSAFSQLPNLIQTSMLPVSQQRLAVAVFGETSRFYGSYFPAVKTPVQKRTLKGEKVPYYVWIVGPPVLVARYAAEVFRNAPAQQAFYGLKTAAPAFAPLLTKLTDPKLKPVGSVWADEEGLHIKPAADEPLDLYVALNLGGLPAAWQLPAFLAQHLQVRLPNGQASLLPNPVRALTSIEQEGQPVLAPFTHLVHLRVSKLGADNPLSISLPAPETPDWVSAWSTTNDNMPAAHTFGLDQILAGVRQSYPTPLPAVFTVQLPLKKD